MSFLGYGRIKIIPKDVARIPSIIKSIVDVIPPAAGGVTDGVEDAYTIVGVGVSEGARVGVEMIGEGDGGMVAVGS